MATEREIAAVDSIKVVCRFRPLNKSEQDDEFIPKFSDTEENCVSLGKSAYSFDKVFKPTASQENVYNDSAKSIVSDVLAGYNGTIFAYGQTSSGKTHTMEGVIDDPSKQGIIPRIVSDIFNHIDAIQENLEFHIKVSYYEIYLERIRDLLDVTKENLSIHEDKNRVPYVKGVTERFVASPEEVFAVIDEGKSNRKIATTKMNEYSSRSHSVFLINVKQENLENEKKLSGKLYLVDLAGSEKVSKTGAEGLVLDEAKMINKSLSALGNVITALATGKKAFVPYRDSKLTRILQESLGGNTRTTIIICCSPASINEPETKSSLDFGKRAKSVTNVVTVNEELTAEEWKKRYEKEKEKCTRYKSQRDILKSELNRWREGEQVNENEQVNLQDLQEPIEASTLNVRSVSVPAVSEINNVSKSISNEDWKKIEEERQSFFKQLDDKDEEINNLSLKIMELDKQNSEQKELLSSIQRDYDQLQQDKHNITQENEMSKEEVQEVLQALEELAVKYDQKNQEFDVKIKENETLSKELSLKESSLSSTSFELQQLKDVSLHENKRKTDILTNLHKDLEEIATTMGCESECNIQQMIDENNKVDEEFIFVRLCINKMKTEVKNIVQRCNSFENSQNDMQKKMNDYEKELADNRLKISQDEAALKSLQELLKETENKKRTLEEHIDVLKEEFAKVKAAEQMSASKEKAEEREKRHSMKAALEQQMNQLQEVHHKQVADLRDEICEKQALVAELKDQVQKYSLAQQQLQTDYNKLLQEDQEKSQRLQEYVLANERREQTRKDLKDVELKVTKELKELHNLRKKFVEDLQSSLKKHAISDDMDEASCDVLNLKQKIKFLENNLDQITQRHQKLVRDNTDLQCEFLKMEKKLRATVDRIKTLEAALKDAKEGALKDRKKYQYEIDRIKDAARQNLSSRGPIIAKPIRPRHYSSSMNQNAEDENINRNSSWYVKFRFTIIY